MQIDCTEVMDNKKVDMQMQNIDVNEVSKHVGLFLSISAGLMVFVKLFCWIRKKIQAYRDKKLYVQRMLEQIEKEQVRIGATLEKMDNERHKARTEDAQVRTTLYLGTVAIVDAIMRLAEHEGLTINGEVKKYRQDNIDNLRNGVGIKPLHATDERD